MLYRTLDRAAGVSECWSAVEVMKREASPLTNRMLGEVCVDPTCNG